MLMLNRRYLITFCNTYCNFKLNLDYKCNVLPPPSAYFSFSFLHFWNG